MHRKKIVSFRVVSLIVTSLLLVLASIISVLNPKTTIAADKAKSNYDDLYDGDWKIPYADWGVERGVITKYDDNTIRVGEEVTEKEFMAMLANYIGLNKNKKIDYLKNEEKLYSDLRKIGVVTEGTVDKSSRKSIMTLDDGLLIIMSLHDKERFKNRKSKILDFIAEVNKDKTATNLKLDSELTKVDVLRILKVNESLGNELTLMKPVHKVGNEWHPIYFADDRLKRISYYEEDSGLLVSVNYISKGIQEDDRVEDYYESLTGKDLASNKPHYIVTVTNVGNTSVELSKFSVNAATNKGKLVLNKRNNSIALNGKATITTLVNKDVNAMSVTVGNTTKSINLKELTSLKANTLYIESDETLKRKPVYVSQSIKDTDYQINEQLFIEYNRLDTSKF